MVSYIKKLWKALKGCEHDYEVVHQDNACSIERCTLCKDTVKYGI